MTWACQCQEQWDGDGSETGKGSGTGDGSSKSSRNTRKGEIAVMSRVKHVSAVTTGGTPASSVRPTPSILTLTGWDRQGGADCPHTPPLPSGQSNPSRPCIAFAHPSPLPAQGSRAPPFVQQPGRPDERWWPAAVGNSTGDRPVA